MLHKKESGLVIPSPSDVIAPSAAHARSPAARRRFQLILVKPSHYDDDGYVIQWLISAMPSNSLAALYGLAEEVSVRGGLGPDVTIDITVIDEMNTRVRPNKLIARLALHGGFGIVCMVGVQSNQFPRALDLARPLLKAGVAVAIGGFHVSGCLAMLSEMPPDLVAALDLGVTLFAGEAENRLEDLLRDAASKRLKPVYNFMNDLPSIRSAPTPLMPRARIDRTIGHWTTFDAGRGCPFQCSFCTIINVQGRKSRHRSPDDIEAIIRANHAQGITRFFITDDNFARNKEWEPIFDRIIALRERAGIDIRLMIQVDTLCHKISNFVEKAARAGVKRVFIGMESINPEALIAAKKRQNKITEYRRLLLAWKQVGVITYAGYILGFPSDTPESIRNDIEIIKNELPIDIMEFFILTPLPGSEDHQVLWKKGVWMDPDMNKYDSEHVVTAHARMTKEDWERTYLDAWRSYYTPAHVETIMRRAAATGIGFGRLLGLLLECSKIVVIEKCHPMQGGIVRIKHRTDRRPGLPREPVWRFYPRSVWELIAKSLAIARQALFLWSLRRKIERDPNRLAYTDEALMPVTEADDTLELFNHNAGARQAVQHSRKITALTGF
jgi:Radical SAM superfamily